MDAVPEPPATPARSVRTALSDFVRDETAGGIVLLAATVAGLLWANAAGSSYASFWSRSIELRVSGVHSHETYAEFVNDGLMAIFFFVVGLEIKRELVVGELRDRRAAALPLAAAVGGMVVPALIFLAVNAGHPELRHGWAIPIATDIAFVMGAIALLGRRVPPALRLFLLTLAIVDDIGGILVIAFVYTDDLRVLWLLGSIGCIAVVIVMRRLGVNRIWPYVVVGVPFWFCTLESGVHATIAGVILGLATPARPLDGRRVLEELEHHLHPVSAFVVVPLFALANTGIVLSTGRLSDAVGSTLASGIVLGLLVGKPVGIAAGTWVARAARIGRLPDGMTFVHVIGGGLLAGIGFTVALFITDLSIGAGTAGDTAKLAILGASTVAAGLGAAFLLAFSRQKKG
jgi:Na+:H+ antiporter, NhaA family